MALSDIRTQIQKELGDRTDINSVIDDQINYAVYEIADTLKIEELRKEDAITPVDGTYEYTLPTDLYSIEQVYILPDQHVIEQKDIKRRDKVAVTTTGKLPRWWSRVNRTISIYNPTPDGDTPTMTIRYMKLPTALSDDTDSHELSADMERGVRLLATSYVFGILNQEERAAAKMSEYGRWLYRKQTTFARDMDNASDSRLKY